MKVKVLFKGPISIVTGEEIELEVSEETKIKDLIEALTEMFYDQAKKKGLEAILRDFTAQNLILVNDREISALNGVETLVKDKDVVKVINFTHGG